MRAWVVKEFGHFSKALRFEGHADPAPPSGGALIEVHAAGVNFFDLLLIAGAYQVRPKLPFIPGSEAVGEVLEPGHGSMLRRGERVMVLVPVGAFGEVVAASDAVCFPAPTEMPDAEAAGFLITYQTALFALTRRARLAAGETLLVHGAAGGVGSAAVQLGKVLGARVIATAGTAKGEACRKLGADVVIDHTRSDFVAEVLKLTDGRGADVILDPIGGEVFGRSTKCIAWEGRLLTLGFASGEIPSIAANRILLKNISVVGLSWGNYQIHDPVSVRAAHAQLLELYSARKVRPLIYREYSFDQLPQALADLEARRTVGKAVIAVPR